MDDRPPDLEVPEVSPHKGTAEDPGVLVSYFQSLRGLSLSHSLSPASQPALQQPCPRLAVVSLEKKAHWSWESCLRKCRPVTWPAAPAAATPDPNWSLLHPLPSSTWQNLILNIGKSLFSLHISHQGILSSHSLLSKHLKRWAIKAKRTELQTVFSFLLLWVGTLLVSELTSVLHTEKWTVSQHWENPGGALPPAES